MLKEFRFLSNPITDLPPVSWFHYQRKLATSLSTPLECLLMGAMLYPNPRDEFQALDPYTDSRNTAECMGVQSAAFLTK